MSHSLVVQPGSRVRLADYDPKSTGEYTDPEQAKKKLKRDLKQIARFQEYLYAGRQYAFLVVLQAMDAGGKDGTIKHVMSGVNPQGCSIWSFKKPTELEASHDFLWRIHGAVPASGMIGIFNRSHYEDVLVPRVHQLVPKQVLRRRYEQINQFEKMLHENRVVILKLFLHISKGEQKRRFQARLKDPEKGWKFAPADMEERKHWDAYQTAYEKVLSRCSTAWAPWRIVPADHKWYRNLVVAGTIRETLQALPLSYPEPAAGLSEITID